MTSPEVVTLGETMRLHVASPGVALRRAVAFTADLAGAESNVAVGLSRLGHRTRWISRVGDDASGQAIIAALRADGVDVSGVAVDPVLPTGLMLRDSHPRRAVTVEYHRRGSAARALSPADVLAAGLDGARHVHVTGITAMLSESAAAAVQCLLDLADAAGAGVSVDPNLRLLLAPGVSWAPVVAPLLFRADVVLAGESELETIGVDVSTLLAGRATCVVVKHPDHTASVTTADGTWSEPSRVRHLVDPVGCGDGLTAGFLSSLLRGGSAAEALRSGVACAAFVAGSVTDTEGLPDRAELDAALAGDDSEMVTR